MQDITYDITLIGRSTSPGGIAADLGRQIAELTRDGSTVEQLDHAPAAFPVDTSGGNTYFEMPVNYRVTMPLRDAVTTAVLDAAEAAQ